MPITNAAGAFNIGRDCTVIIRHPLAPNGRIDIPNVTGFEAKQQTAQIGIDRLDGVQLFAELPKGWTGSFMAERGSSGLDDLFALIEAGWYSTGITPDSTLYQYISETNGATSTYQFIGVAIKFGDAGSWRGDQTVKQTLDFRATRRQRV